MSAPFQQLLISSVESLTCALFLSSTRTYAIRVQTEHSRCQVAWRQADRQRKGLKASLSQGPTEPRINDTGNSLCNHLEYEALFPAEELR